MEQKIAIAELDPELLVAVGLQRAPDAEPEAAERWARMQMEIARDLGTTNEATRLYALLLAVQERATEAAQVAEHRLVREHPCRCDPPGSGEEWCTGHCELRAALAAAQAREAELRKALQTIATDAWAVCAQVCTEAYRSRGRHASDCPHEFAEEAEAALEGGTP